MKSKFDQIYDNLICQSSNFRYNTPEVIKTVKQQLSEKFLTLCRNLYKQNVQYYNQFIAKNPTVLTLFASDSQLFNSNKIEKYKNGLSECQQLVDKFTNDQHAFDQQFLETLNNYLNRFVLVTNIIKFPYLLLNRLITGIHFAINDYGFKPKDQETLTPIQKEVLIISKSLDEINDKIQMEPFDQIDRFLNTTVKNAMKKAFSEENQDIIDSLNNPIKVNDNVLIGKSGDLLFGKVIKISTNSIIVKVVWPYEYQVTIGREAANTKLVVISNENSSKSINQLIEQQFKKSNLD